MKHKYKVIMQIQKCIGVGGSELIIKAYYSERIHFLQLRDHMQV